uniref:Uncharacterized protein n=1 Tax=Araneus ventricosus TaxID=182803 RepID=A0A4Y2CXJ7_ARAVE|nr:hypothetical protein AVEN_238628-1 [Araneus ventricosus]
MITREHSKMDERRFAHIFIIGTVGLYQTSKSAKRLTVCIQGALEKFGEWSHKIKETRYKNKMPLLGFKVIAISYNTLLTSVVQLLETVSKHFFRYRSKHRCHTLLDLRNVGKA